MEPLDSEITNSLKVTEGKEDVKWREWLKDEGHVFLELPFPPAAFIDRKHFDCFIRGYTDVLVEHEELISFDLGILNDKEAMRVLLALENYVVEPLMTWMLIELRYKFNLSCEFENDGETWVPVPQDLINQVLNTID